MVPPSSSGFDPYFKWLGIPPSEQPPNHYRLLGVRLFEDDLDVIAASADRQMAYVKSFASGPYSKQSQALLTHLAKARVCLLNRQRKLHYDRQLQKLRGIEKEENTQHRFDPYHHWLSIPPEEQPPNHYRLLGLKNFEGDADVIQAAADRQSHYVRKHLGSHLEPYAENLLRELDVARQGLTSPTAKAAYDDWLSSSPSTTQIRAQPAEADTNEARPAPNINSPSVVPHFSKNSKSRKSARTRAPLLTLILPIVAPLLGLFAGYLVLRAIDPEHELVRFVRHLGTRPEQGNRDSSSAKSPPRASPSDTKGGSLPMGIPSARQIEPRLDPRPQRARNDNVQQQQRSSSKDSIGSSFSHFRTLRINVEIPPLDTVGPVSVVDLPQTAVEDADVLLLSNSHNGTLTLHNETTGMEQQWAVKWSSHEDADESPQLDKGDDASRIATLVFAQGELQFEWLSEAPLEAHTALRNALLEIRTPRWELMIGLRKPIVLPENVFDLERSVYRIPLKADDLPAEQALYVELQLEGFPDHRIADADLSRLRINDEATIWYSGVEGVATRCILKKRGKYPLLEFDSRYKLPSGDEEPLSISRGNIKMRDIGQNLTNAKSAASALPRMENHLSRVRAILRSAGDPQTRIKAQLEFDKTRGQIAVAKSLIAATPQIQSDLAAIKSVAQLAEQLHQRAKLRFRLCHLIADHEVVLLVDASRQEEQEALSATYREALIELGESMSESESSESQAKQDSALRVRSRRTNGHRGPLTSQNSNDRFSLLGIATQNIASEDGGERYEWTLEVKNNIHRMVRLHARVRWLDEKEELVADQSVRDLTLEARESRTFQGHKLIAPVRATRISAIEADVREVR